MLTEFSLLTTRLTASMKDLFFSNTRSIMTSTLTSMSTWKHLTTHSVTEYLLSIARNTLHNSMTSLTHTFRQLRTRRTRTKVTSMVRIQMTSWTAFRTRQITNRWRRPTHHRRLDDCLSTSACDWCRQDMLTWDAGTRMARKIAMMLSTVQQLITCLSTYMERAIRLLALMRTTQFHTLMSATIHISLTGSRTDERLTSLCNLLFC